MRKTKSEKSGQSKCKKEIKQAKKLINILKRILKRNKKFCKYIKTKILLNLMPHYKHIKG